MRIKTVLNQCLDFKCYEVMAKKQFNSGIVEGLNRKINLTIRKSFGFRTIKIAKICLYHQLGELPEPTFTHEFW